MKRTSELILEYVEAKGKAKPGELAGHLGLSRVAVHRQLKKLVEEGKLEKQGLGPKVRYVCPGLVKKIKPVLERYGVSRAEVFGSVARGEGGPKSDIDILVQMPRSASLMDVGKLYEDLKLATGREVDMVEYEAINPYIKDSIMARTVKVI